MSSNVNDIIILATEFEKMATQSLVKTAAKKDKKDKKDKKKPGKFPFWLMKNKDKKPDSEKDSKKDSKKESKKS